jgi:hypothetical protein
LGALGPVGGLLVLVGRLSLCRAYLHYHFTKSVGQSPSRHHHFGVHVFSTGSLDSLFAPALWKLFFLVLLLLCGVDSTSKCDKSEEPALQTFLFRRKPHLPMAYGFASKQKCLFLCKLLLI